MAATSTNPLVTEWPASEKAHLQSLTATQTVAVQYSGCELRIVDACKLPGSYGWRRTTLATDTVEIANSDELFAKLPIGAVGLEGELARSGRLAVRTTVAGQLRSEGVPTSGLPSTGPCAEATHYISAISIGAFKLLSGTRVGGGGRVGIGGVGAGVSSQRREVVLREAGAQNTCQEATDEAAHSQCASPIQLFLSPLRLTPTGEGAQIAAQEEAARAAGGVFVQIPAPEEPEEKWTLRDKSGRLLCETPCGHWVGPVSGYYLQREKSEGVDVATVNLPESFPHVGGSRVYADYQAERGSPTLSTLTFWGVGVSSAVLGLVILTAGIVQAAADMDCGGEDRCFPLPSAAGNIALSTMYLGIAGGSAYWYFWSHREQFNTHEGTPPPGTQSDSARTEGPRVLIGPTGLVGTF